MNDIKFDFNNMMSFNVGSRDGVTEYDLRRLMPRVDRCHRHFRRLSENPASRVHLSLEWLMLPFQDKKTVEEIQRLGDEIGRQYENVLSLGIGGSYLGLKSAQEALCAPYYNEFPQLRQKRSRIYFEGNNLDPTPLAVLLRQLDPKKTFVTVISKSGETTETKAVFDVVEEWLKAGAGAHYGRQIIAITDPKSGTLRKKVLEEQARDPSSFRSLPLLPGVGGRFSEFNMGLLHLAVVGVDITEVFSGAQAMARRCSSEDIFKNPAYMYASLHHLAHLRKGKSIAIMMPFSEGLKSTADWYCQLLAESIGKKYPRRIKALGDSGEAWEADTRRPVHAGRTPVATRGTTDLHSIQQNNVEGPSDKAVTMIRIASFADDVTVPAGKGFLSQKRFSELLALAQEATAWALTSARRPNCTITLSQLSAWTWGGLLYFFEMATAFEGELLNVNAFDQPGVESYKNYMYYKLRKPGIPEKIAQEIEKHPVKSDVRFIL